MKKIIISLVVLVVALGNPVVASSNVVTKGPGLDAGLFGPGLNTDASFGGPGLDAGSFGPGL